MRGACPWEGIRNCYITYAAPGGSNLEQAYCMCRFLINPSRIPCTVEIASLKIYAIGAAQEPAPQCASRHASYWGESCSSIEEDYGLPVGQVQEANSDLDCTKVIPRDTLVYKFDLTGYSSH